MQREGSVNVAHKPATLFNNIAEVTVVLRGIVDKPFLVTMNETFLSKAIEHVELERYQVLMRRHREGQWEGGVLVFVLTNTLPE